MINQISVHGQAKETKGDNPNLKPKKGKLLRQKPRRPRAAAGFVFGLAAGLLLFGYSGLASGFQELDDRPPEEALTGFLQMMERAAEYHLKRINRLQRDARDAVQQIRSLENQKQRLEEEIEFINQKGRPMRHSDRHSYSNGR